MTSYLLLRNNKESGPFSLNELITLGLKPYDLVWVNGKSAAWRYPGEITELAAYAPVVEEQPYDRFYKKNTVTEEAKESPAVQQTAIKDTVPVQEVRVQEIKPIQQTPVKEVEHTREPEPDPVVAVVTPKTTPQARKSVFVTMPGQQYREPIVETPPVPKEKPVARETVIQPTFNEPVYNEPVKTEKVIVNEAHQQYSQYLPKQTSIHDKYAEQDSPTISITENPVTAEIKYSQPLDEIKEMYVRTLQERKQKKANKVLLLQTFKKVAVLLAIVGAGILIGFTIKGNGDNRSLAASAAQEQKEKPATNTEQTPIEENGNELNSELPSDNLSAEHQTIKSNARKNLELQEDKSEHFSINSATRNQGRKGSSPIVTEKKAVMEPISTPARREPTIENTKEPVIEEPTEGVDINAQTGERNRKVRNVNSENNESGSEMGSSQDKEFTPPANRNQESSSARNYGKENSKPLFKQVSIKSNFYKIVPFGGIRDLQLTVFNDSKYILDNVTVELEYVRPNELLLRKETLQFRSISPFGSLTMRVPDTNRGIKVRYRIVHIQSTQSAKDMADL